MPLETTIGQLLVNQALPADMRDHNRVLDKGGLSTLLERLAERDPDDYRKTTHRLLQVGRDVAYRTGGFSFGLDHLSPSARAQEVRQKIEDEVSRIDDDPRYADDEDAREKAILDTVQKHHKGLVDAVYGEARSANNPLALQVQSGARGKPFNLNSLLGFDGLYVDHRGELVPVPILSSYSAGLTPAEYFAGAYGARKGVVDTKMAVAQAGFFSKQLMQAAHRLVVTGDDEEQPDEHASARGLPSPVDDPDNEGALLAREAAGYPRNTVLTARILADIRSRLPGKRILVRSPIVGGSPDGGVYARDVGIREKGRLAPRGDYVGIAAAQSIGEKMSQGMLCLAAGTKVRMASGKNCAIEKITVGDFVLGFDTKRQIPVPVRVQARYDNGPRECLWARIGPAEIVATGEHRLYGMVLDENGAYSMGQAPLWAFTTQRLAPVVLGPHVIRAENVYRRMRGSLISLSRAEQRRALRYGDAVACLRASAESREVKPAGTLPTYDIEVDHPDHLFILANGLVVSNSSKHSGGVAGAEKATGGFGFLNSLVQVPRVFPSGATHAQADGTVGAVREAPQGGHYVSIDGKDHYVSSDRKLLVKPGDTVEAGDVLDDGTPNPAEIVRHKGIGEGRRYFMEAFGKGYANSGMQAHRRNLELVARGLINHVELQDEIPDSPYVPGDIVPYTMIERTWHPRDSSYHTTPKQAVGRYLERPVLHHTIGTRIRPSMLPDFEEFGINNLHVSDDPPPFSPTMVRGMANLQYDEDWMTRHLGSGLQRPFLDAAARGGVSDESGTSYVPAMANRTTFGLQGKTQGWDPDDDD